MNQVAALGDVGGSANSQTGSGGKPLHHRQIGRDSEIFSDDGKKASASVASTAKTTAMALNAPLDSGN